MVIETVTGSKARGSLRRADGQTHGVAVLGMANHLRADGLPAAQWAAQLAHDLVPFIEVDALAHERRAPTIRAQVSPGRERAHALAQQLALQLGSVPW